eukprot:361367-Chlamydomonas_euryale.AAC.4
MAEVAVDGDMGKVISEIDTVLSSESVTGKEVSDAAVALVYLQAKGDRRWVGHSMQMCMLQYRSEAGLLVTLTLCRLHVCSIWGKVFLKALGAKNSFDAASLTAFMWAATTAGVGHFKTVRLVEWR